jgi:hypothetical protein
VHCVLSKDLSYDEAVNVSLFEGLKRIGVKVKNKALMPFLKYKYIDKPFNK